MGVSALHGLVLQGGKLFHSNVQVLNEKQLELAHANNFNFDHPGVSALNQQLSVIDAFDLELMENVLEKLKLGQKVDVFILVNH